MSLKSLLILSIIFSALITSDGVIYDKADPHRKLLSGQTTTDGSPGVKCERRILRSYLLKGRYKSK